MELIFREKRNIDSKCRSQNYNTLFPLHYLYFTWYQIQLRFLRFNNHEIFYSYIMKIVCRDFVRTNARLKRTYTEIISEKTHAT